MTPRFEQPQPTKGRWKLRCGRIAATAIAAALFASAAVRAQDELDDYKLAIGLYNKQRWDLAAESFQKFLTENPDHAKAPFAWLYLGTTLRKQQKYDEARKALRQFVAKYPQNKNVPYALFRIGECSYFLGELKEAESELQKFCGQYPDHELNEWALPNLADARLRLDKPKLAEEGFRDALKRYPDGKMAEDSRFGLARALESQKQYPEAVQLYEQLASNNDGAFAPQAQLNLATRHFDSGEYAKASAKFAELEQRFPESRLVAFAQLNGGFSQFQLGNFREAIAKFAAAAQHKEHATTAQFWTGLSHKSLADYAQAARHLKAAYDADPKGPLAEESLYQQADCEYRVGNFKSAHALFLEVVQNWPKGRWGGHSLYFAAEAALSEKKFDESERLIARFTAEFPQSDLRWKRELLKGRLLEERGGKDNQQAAALQFEQVIAGSKGSKDESHARFYLARIQRKTGDHAAAVKSIAPLIETVVKEGAQSEFVDALILYASSLMHTKAYEKSAQAASQYLQLRPDGDNVDEALATLSLAHAHQGHRKEAEDNLSQLSQKFPAAKLTDETTHQVAEIAFAAEKWEWAGSLFDRLLERGKESPYHAAALSGTAWCMYRQKKFREAADGFDRALKEHPENVELGPEAAYMRAMSLHDAGDMQAAQAAFSAAFARYAPESAKKGEEEKGAAAYAYRSGLQAARTLHKLGQVEDADRAYEALLKRFPHPGNLDRVLDEWALLHHEAKKYDRSDEIFRRLVKEAPNSDLADNARLSLAESDHAAGRFDEAKKAFSELEAAAKSDPLVQDIALQHLIAIAVEKRAWKDVLGSSAKLASRFPKSDYTRNARFYAAEANLNAGNLNEARKALDELQKSKTEESVRQAEWFPKLWILQAEIAFREKKYDQVTALVADLRKSVPESPLLYQGDDVLGRSLKNQSKFDEARAAFSRVVEDKTGRRTETAAKCQFMIADTYLMQKQIKEAQREYFKVYHLYQFPAWQAPALFQAASCDEALGQWEQAAKSYEELIKEFPKTEFAGKAEARLQVARKRISS
ncbi:MAG: tetratricopeptide repeat protein [Planctomycetaceae bacterium]